MPFWFYFFMLVFHQFIVLFICAKIENPDCATFFSTDKCCGAFGFFDPSQALVALVLYGIFASFFGNIGYVISTYFYPPQVSATALLFEPAIAQTIGFIFNIDKFPGPLTIIGAICAIIGLYLFQIS